MEKFAWARFVAAVATSRLEFATDGAGVGFVAERGLPDLLDLGGLPRLRGFESSKHKEISMRQTDS